ncbi:MAG TPA: L,D-transpeptidase [Sporichthyaceae bacterium]
MTRTRIPVLVTALCASLLGGPVNAAATTVPPFNRPAFNVAPANGATVGVAQPLAVTFAQPVTDRRAVQSSLQVTTSPQVRGAWYWLDDSHVDYRPASFWPAGTRVALRTGPGAPVSAFTVGRRQVIRVDAKQHRMVVLRDGVPIKRFRVSTGKDGWETRNGTEVMMDRVGAKHWTPGSINAPEQYSLYSKYAIRITQSGEFVHDAPWNHKKIGRHNTTHGCVGLRTADAKWIWQHSMLGDPVIVHGSSSKTPQVVANRYDDWNIPWTTWVKGNAVGNPAG